MGKGDISVPAPVVSESKKKLSALGRHEVFTEGDVVTRLRPRSSAGPPQRFAVLNVKLEVLSLRDLWAGSCRLAARRRGQILLRSKS